MRVDRERTQLILLRILGILLIAVGFTMIARGSDNRWVDRADEERAVAARAIQFEKQCDRADKRVLHLNIRRWNDVHTTPAPPSPPEPPHPPKPPKAPSVISFSFVR